MDKDFSRQTRRFSSAILTDGKGNRRSMAGKRPARRRTTVVNTASYGDSAYLGIEKREEFKILYRTRILHRPKHQR